MRRKIRNNLYFTYLLAPVNVSVSGFISIVIPEPFFNTFGIMLISIGFGLSLLFFDFFDKEYYFFFRNNGLSPLFLFGGAWLIYVFIYLLLLIVNYYVL